jgi:hypothetical protein
MPKAPSAFEIEAAMAALKRAHDRLVDQSLIRDESEISTALDMSWAEVDDILARLLRAASWCGGMAEEADARAKQAASRSGRYKEREKVLRQEIADLMQILGRKQFATGDISCHLNSGVRGVRVTDRLALDEKYLSEHSLPTPNIRAIRADLEDGVIVEGAELSNAQPFLVIQKG